MNNFEYGFITKCAEYGVDPEMLIKVAAPIRIVKSLPKYVATRLSKNPVLKTVQQNTIDPKKSRGLFSWLANRGIKKNNTEMGNLASQYMSTNNLPGFKNVQGGKLYSKGVADQHLARFDDIWNRNQKFLTGKYGNKENYIKSQMARNFNNDITSINNVRNGMFNRMEEFGLRNRRLNDLTNSGLVRFGDVALNTAGIAGLIGGAGYYGYNQLAGNPNNDSGYTATQTQPQPQPSVG